MFCLKQRGKIGILKEGIMEEEEKEYITKEELNQELADEERPLPKRHGRLALLLGAVLLIAAGAMTGYYWYLFQRNQGSETSLLRSAWEEAVLATNSLSSSLSRVETYQGFLDLKSELNQTQRRIRDARTSLPAASGQTPSLGQIRLSAFLDDYADLLVVIDRLISEGEDIDSQDKLSDVKESFKSLEESYDELLIAGRGFIKSNLPRAFFNFPDKLQALLEQFLTDKGKDNQSEETAKRFVVALIDRNEAELKKYLTAKAKADFNPGILEDTREFSDFSVISREKKDGLYLVRGQIKVTTPDGASATETWEFKLKEEDKTLLIDSWGKV